MVENQVEMENGKKIDKKKEVQRREKQYKRK